MRVASLAVLLAVLTTSCSSIAVTNNTFALANNDRIKLSSVQFAYANWQNQDPQFIDKMKEKEAVWRDVITKAFHRRASAVGLESGTGAEIPVSFSIDDLDPGSQAARYWVGFGAGKGQVRILVDGGSTGSLNTSGEVGGGFFGGSFNGVLRQLTGRAVDAIAASRK